MATPGNNFECRKKVLGYPIDNVDQTLALSMIKDSWSHQRKMHIVTLNAEMLISAQRDNRLDRIIRHAHLIVPDGAGPLWALKLDGHQSQRVPGVELAHAALHEAAKEGVRVSLIGSKQEVIDSLLEKLPLDHPGLNIVSYHDGYFSKEEEEAVVTEIAESNPQLVLVALGVPRQEYFIDKWMSLFPEAVLMGVGGSFDVFAGVVQRAPQMFQRLHLEWFYRLVKEPWRFKRMASTLPNFAMQVLLRRFFDPKANQIPTHQLSHNRKVAPPRRHGNEKQNVDKKKKKSSDGQ